MALRVRLAGLALVAVALAAAAWLAAARGAVADPAAELARLVPGHRPLLARTSLPLPYAPFDPAAPPVDRKEREAIYARLLGGKDAGAARAAPAFYVTRGEPGDAERALAEAADPVDRGAVLLALDRPDEALEAFAKALETRPGDPAALFDRALALEALLLDGQAAAAWEEFLAAEPTGGWADEARDRLAASRRPVPPTDRPLDLQKREATERFLEARGPGELDALAPVAARVAAAGDLLLERELRYLASLDDAGWRRRDREVRRYLAARERVFAGREADRELLALESSGEPLLAVKAVHFAAYGAIRRGDRAGAAAALGRLEDACRRLGCREELALVASDLGTLHEQAGDYRAAGLAYERGAALLPPGFAGRAAEIRIKQAVLATQTGASAEAARLFLQGLRLEREIGASHTMMVTLTGRAMAVRKLGWMHTAEATLQEAIDRARADPDHSERVRAAQALADFLEDTGRTAAAVALLEATIADLRSTELWRQLSGCLDDLARLQLAGGDLAAADAAAREAVDLARLTGAPPKLARALDALARTAVARGDRQLSLASSEEAVRIDAGRIEHTSGILPARRLATAVAERRLLLAELRADAGDPAGAVEAFLGGPPSPSRADECRLGVAALDDRLLAFAWSTGGARFERRPIGAGAGDRVEGAVAFAVGALLGGPASPGPCPDGVRRVVVHDAPGALVDPVLAAVRRARPGAIAGVALTPEARWPEAPARLAALAVYAVDASDAEAAPALPAGAEEADDLARSWRSVRRLTGAAATPAALAAGAADADLLHFAVHGSSGDRTSASHLLLAGDEGRLQVADVLALDLHERRPLVVLSSCRTADPSSNLEEDGAGIPWAFLAAGASAVVAHRGPLDDRQAASFSRAFYGALGAGASVADALAVARAAIPVGRGDGYVLFFP